MHLAPLLVVMFDVIPSVVFLSYLASANFQTDLYSWKSFQRLQNFFIVFKCACSIFREQRMPHIHFSSNQIREFFSYQRFITSKFSHAVYENARSTYFNPVKKQTIYFILFFSAYVRLQDFKCCTLLKAFISYNCQISNTFFLLSLKWSIFTFSSLVIKRKELALRRPGAHFFPNKLMLKITAKNFIINFFY